jgi:hypothetical protein
MRLSSLNEATTGPRSLSCCDSDSLVMSLPRDTEP